MKKLSRRDFIGQSSLAFGSAFLFSELPAAALQGSIRPASRQFGFQTWTIRDQLSKDLAGTLKMMSGMGYQTAEMCSPSGYVNAGFAHFVKMTGQEIRQAFADAGITCPSCHFNFGEMQQNLDDRIEFARALGLKAMICSSFGLPETATLKQYQEAAQSLNKIAEKISQAGLQTGFHNHEMEFAVLDGQLIYDALMTEFDPKLVKMQFQTEVINLGYKAATYFKKYPGRFISAHMSDWTQDKKEVPIGQGVIDWKEFYAAAPAGGVETYYVEMSMETFRDSAAYLKQFQVA